MVTVPTEKTTSRGVRAAPAVFQSTNVPSGAFDGGGAGLVTAGRAIGDLGDQLGTLALNMQREDNDAEVKAGDVAMSEAMRAVVWGGENGAGGYYNTKGKNSYDEYGAAEDTMREALNNIAEGSSNDAVRAKLAQMGEARLQSELDKMTAHASRGREDYLDGVGVAREAQAAEDARVAWQDDSVISRSIGLVSMEIRDRIERKGMSEEEFQVELVQKRGVVVNGAFQTALQSRDVIRAQDILTKYGDAIDSATKAKMETSLLADTESTTSQTLAESAIAKFPQDVAAQRDYIRGVTSGQQEDDAVAELNSRVLEARGDYKFERSVTDEAKSGRAEQRAVDSEARTIVNHQNTLRKREEKRVLNVANREAHEFMYSTVGTTPRTVAQFRSENPAAYERMVDGDDTSRDYIAQLKSLERNIAEGNLYASSSDGKSLTEILTMPINERENVDLAVAQSTLTLSEYNKAVTSVNSAGKEMNALEEDKASFSAGRSSIVRSLARSFDPNAPSKRTRAERQAIQEADSEMGDFITGILAQGRKPTQKELDRRAAELAVKITSDPWFFSGEGTSDAFSGLAVQAGKMSPAQRADAIVSIEDIPPVINDQIDKWLTSRNIDRNNDSLRQQLAAAIALRDINRVQTLLREAGNN